MTKKDEGAVSWREYVFDHFSTQEVTIHNCQAGYHTTSVKQVVIWSIPAATQGHFEIREVATECIVWKGQLCCKGKNAWGRHDWLADFTALRTEGTYRIHAFLGSGYDTVSEPFRISSSFYAGLLEKSCKHVFLKRCGLFCHPHDGMLRNTGQKGFGKVLKHLDASGGWHDAHDDCKWVALSTWLVIYSLCEVHEKVRPEWKWLKEPCPYPLSEARWGVDFLLRMQKNDGSFYAAVMDWNPQKRLTTGEMHNKPHGLYAYDDFVEDQRVVCDHWGKGKMDRLLGGDSFRTGLVPSTPELYHVFLAAAVARFARLTEEFDSPLAKKCERSVAGISHWLEKRRISDYQYIGVQSGSALLNLELWKGSRQKEFLEKAEGFLLKVVNLQQPEGYFRAAQKLTALEMYPEEAADDRALLDYPFHYLIALVKYVDYVPSGRLVPVIKKSLTEFIRLVQHLTSSTIFGHMVEFTLRKNPEIILSRRKARHGYNSYLLSIAYLAAKISEILQDKKYLQIAEKQIQWILGANPRAMSFMNDTGYRRVNKHPLFCNRQGRDIKWGITTGIYGPGESQPKNYPHAGVSEEGGYDSGAEETWLTTTAWFILAVSQFVENGEQIADER